MKKTILSIALFAIVASLQAQTATTDEGVLIGTTVWATRNVDMPGTFAETPESAGKFYQWNSTVAWSTTDPLASFPGGNTWNPMWNGNNATVWEAANNVCPTGWRLPTNAEINELINAGSEWITTPAIGRIYGGSLFFLASGHRIFNYSPGRLELVDRNACFWSSEINSDYAYHMAFNSTETSLNSFNRSYGFCVRCVKDNSISAVNDISEESRNVVGYFDVLGRKFTEEPTSGIYIIVYDNGKTEKILK